MLHTSVLLHESVDNLNLSEGEIFVDGTLGSAGHSALIAERLGDSIEIIGLDRDPQALERSEERLRTLSSNIFLRKASFRNMDTVLHDLGVSGVDGILLDLGISSDQIESSGRGFTFQKDEPLLMTMDNDDSGVTAQTILNTWGEDTLELILKGFGEEKFAWRIAKEIVHRREIKPFVTTFDLIEAVRAATPAAYHRGRIHPATRTFQALRIAVNQELDALTEGIEKGFDLLNPEGRMAVISFHSLEDRIVKQAFREKSNKGFGKLITKKPISPSDEEMSVNPRSRSAKLRVIEKL